VQVLAVPELIPFRLSRVMVGALSPFGADALKKPLAAALDTFRSAQPVLEAILTVFMTEPLTEWQREAEVVLAKVRRARQVPDTRVSMAQITSKLILWKTAVKTFIWLA
jgi:phosphatidylinositol kinase/protein kinase (PI-3  family)